MPCLLRSSYISSGSCGVSSWPSYSRAQVHKRESGGPPNSSYRRYCIWVFTTRSWLLLSGRTVAVPMAAIYLPRAFHLWSPDFMERAFLPYAACHLKSKIQNNNKQIYIITIVPFLAMWHRGLVTRGFSSCFFLFKYKSVSRE